MPPSDAQHTEHLWELLSEKLRGFLLRRVSDPQVADDLLQETFLRIHQNIGELDDRGPISAWVFRVARNLVVDYYRSNKNERAKPNAGEIALPEAGDNLNSLVAGWLPEMIAALPEPYREAVALYELEGVAQQAIAGRLGLSLSGTKSRIQRGRSKLRKMLLDCCSFEQDRRGNIIDYKRNEPRDCCKDDC